MKEKNIEQGSCCEKKPNRRYAPGSYWTDVARKRGAGQPVNVDNLVVSLGTRRRNPDVRSARFSFSFQGSFLEWCWVWWMLRRLVDEARTKPLGTRQGKKEAWWLTKEALGSRRCRWAQWDRRQIRISRQADLRGADGRKIGQHEEQRATLRHPLKVMTWYDAGTR